ncbi:MAG: nucleotide sugar dehydrogenase [Candidatus Saccharibacteria bacterium]
MKKVAVFGLGFVGLPLALSFAMRGCQVYGVDIDPNLINELNNGVTHHLEAYGSKSIQQILREELDSGRFQATGDGAQAIKECANIIVTVGIPVTDSAADMKPLEMVCKTIAMGLKANDVLLIRSTVIPGTTRRHVVPWLETSGLRAGEDFYLAYSSERIAEGKAFYEFENMPAVLAGINAQSTDKAVELMSIVTKAEIHKASQMEVVECAKVMENVSRDVNIAMSNEFARYTASIGVDIFEVIRAANTHQRVNLLTPGPGVGGYCLPNALYYLLPRTQETGLDLPLLKTARAINDSVPAYVAGMALRNLPVPPNQAKLAVLGIAMKDYSNDDRISPAIDVIGHLQMAGCTVAAYDPAVPTPRDFKVESLDDALDGAHGVLVLACQDGIDYHNLELFKQKLAGAAPFIVDVKNIYSHDEMERIGLRLITL